MERRGGGDVEGWVWRGGDTHNVAAVLLGSVLAQRFASVLLAHAPRACCTDTLSANTSYVSVMERDKGSQSGIMKAQREGGARMS